MQEAYNKNVILSNCNISAHVDGKIISFCLANRRQISCQLYNSIAISNSYFIIIFIILVDTKQIS